MKILVSVDDGCALDTKIAKLCEKYSFDAVFFWPVDFITLAIQKGYEPLSGIQESYISRNFEIGSHGVTHAYLTKIPLEAAKMEIEESKKMLENKYDQNINRFCYPRGYANESIIKFVKEAGYTYGRSTAIGYIGEPNNNLFAETSVHIGCPVRPEYQGTTWQEYGLKLAKEAASKNLLFHIWCHSWEIEKYNQWREVNKFFKEVSKL